MTPDIPALVQAALDAKAAEWEAEREAARQQEREQKAAEDAAWRSALGPMIVACGVRPLLVDSILERARSIFELRDGEIRPRLGVYHPRDPIAELSVLDWLADLHATNENLVFPKERR